MYTVKISSTVPQHPLMVHQRRTWSYLNWVDSMIITGFKLFIFGWNCVKNIIYHKQNILYKLIHHSINSTSKIRAEVLSLHFMHTNVAPNWAIRWRLLLSSIKNATKSKQTMKKRFDLRHRSNYLTKLYVSLFLNKLFFATFWFNELSKIGVFNHRSKLKWGIHKARWQLRGRRELV